MIEVIGDSHTFIFTGSDVAEPTRDRENGFCGFHIQYIGPVLAWSLTHAGAGRDLFWRSIGNVPPGSTILTVFGEIDCRAHLYRQAIKQKRNMRLVAEDCASMYADVLEEVRNRGHFPVAWSVIPATNFPVLSKKWPAEGTLRERRAIIEAFNAQLAAKTTTASVYGELVREDGSVREEFYLDAIHLSKKALPMAKAEIERAIEMRGPAGLGEDFRAK